MPFIVSGAELLAIVTVIGVAGNWAWGKYLKYKDTKLKYENDARIDKQLFGDKDN